MLLDGGNKLENERITFSAEQYKQYKQLSKEERDLLAVLKVSLPKSPSALSPLQLHSEKNTIFGIPDLNLPRILLELPWNLTIYFQEFL